MTMKYIIKNCKNCKHYLPPQQEKEGPYGIGYYCALEHKMLRYAHCKEHEFNADTEE